jgi:hypothetical protein
MRRNWSPSEPPRDCASREERRVWNHSNDEVSLQTQMNSTRRRRLETEVVDGLENRSPGCDTDTGSDEHGDFVLEDVFGGRSVGSVDAESRHLLAVLESDLVHAHGVELVVELGLRLAGTKGIGKGAGEVTDLTDVNGNVVVVRARGDGKGMPLVVADFRAVEEEPLSGLVLHAGLGELNLNGIYSSLVSVCSS